MNKKQRKGFTLVELVAVLVILAILASIVTPLVLNLIKKSRLAAYKRSIDGYGKALEISVMNYLIDTGFYPTDLSTLKVEYTGDEVVCNVMYLNSDSSIYLSECTVDGDAVTDSKNKDGYYHYGKKEVIPAAQSLITKANSEKVTTYEGTGEEAHQMYTFSHSATSQTEALTDYRYIGNNPYNYVTFNDELWRIIGVFTVEDEEGNLEQRIKIIKNEEIGRYAWDTNDTNNWINSTLQTYLNGDYYNSLSEGAKSMVGATKFYLGGRAEDSVTHFGTGTEIYVWERGETVYTGRSTNWTGNIAVMYPSDFAYSYAYGVDDVCYNDGNICNTSNPASSWLYTNGMQWLLSPDSSITNFVLRARSTGVAYFSSRVTNVTQVRPVLYLNSNIEIIDGDGSETSPYQLEIIEVK